MMLKLVLAFVLASGLVNADPVVHKFEIWGRIPQETKGFTYLGWTNGFFLAKDAHAFQFAQCLEGMSPTQAVAMIDKYYKDHPEKWSDIFGTQILQALLVVGGPCEGKYLLTAETK
jgi:hypothetical protein